MGQENPRGRAAHVTQTLFGFGEIGHDFKDVADHLLLDPSVDITTRRLLEFAMAFAKMSFGEAERAIHEASGIPLDIAIPHTSKRGAKLRTPVRPAMLVGVFGAGETTRTRDRFLRGVAVAADSHGREEFVAVRVFEDGTAHLDPDHVIATKTALDIVKEALSTSE